MSKFPYCYRIVLALYLVVISPILGAYIEGEYRSGEILIETTTPLTEFESRSQSTRLSGVFARLPQLQSITRINHRTQAQIQSAGPQKYLYKLTVPESEDLLPQCTALMTDNTVKVAQPNFIYTTQFHPNDTRYNANQQNYMNFIKAEDAWDITKGTRNVTIAVIDTGALLTHDDLKNKFWENPGEIANNHIDDDFNGFSDDVVGYDFVNNDSSPNDDNGHGSHVSGILGAQTNNSTGIAGICQNCSVMVLKAGTASGLFSTQDLLDAISYATNNGANIINMSLGGTFSSGSDLLLQAQVNNALSHGVYVVAAAGNNQDNLDTERFRPASYPGVITVSGADTDGTFAESWGGGFGSNFGNSVDIMAPGTDIISSDISGQSTSTYFFRDGTSMAAPIVSGALGLILSINPTISTTNAYKALVKGATDKESAGKDTFSGYGLLDLKESLLIAQDTQAPTISVTLDSDEDIQSSYPIIATITDNGPNIKQSNIPTASAYYRYVYTNTSPGSFSRITLTRNGSTFTGTIPSANGVPEGYHYYIEATDLLDQTSTSPENAPSNFYSVSIQDQTSPNITFRHSENDIIPKTVKVFLTDNLAISPNSIVVVISSQNNTSSTHKLTDSNSILSLDDDLLSIDLNDFSFDQGDIITVEVSVEDQAGISASNTLSFLGPQATLALFGPEGEGSPVVAVPNPFNPKTGVTTLWFQSTMQAEVQISIYSLNLELIKEMEGTVSPGPVTSFTWNGTDTSNRIVPNGVYIAIIKATSTNGTVTKRVKIALLR